MEPSILARDDASGRPPMYKAIGISLAVASGLFIGVSFVIKKIGLLKANVKYNEEAGEGYGYLRNFWWWTGMTLMIVGEICNFVAYAFVDAILVTPLGALAVVVTTILSAIFLKERLSFVGKVGCFSCIIGSVVIAMNAPEQSSVSDIQDMKKYVVTPGFLSYAGVIVLGCAFTAFWAGPRYGKKNMFVYISICSLIGGLSVVATQGLGSAILAQINGKSQFKEWFLYVLLVFVIATLLTEIIYLNKALNIFNAALVTPTYYVFFTTCTIVTSAVLFQGFQGTGKEIATVVMGFLQICAGVVLLQLSKSAKDVPDAAVFKGDLDQVREVATQEESETEPKADSIRGAAAIVRQLSSTRRKGEEEEIRRYFRERSEDLKPLGENEAVEWDGLRRRKTVLGAARSHTPSSAKSSLPPLGMSHFPEEEQGQDTDRPNRSFIDGIRSRASSLLHPHWRPVDDYQSALEKNYHGEMPPNTTDFAYRHSPTPQTTPQPVYSGGKRQFSFNTVLNRLRSRPSSPAHGILRATPTSAEKEALKNATEEERLGLVLGGDSHRPEDDELDERLARTESVSSSNSSLGGGQALMDRLHQSLDEATRIYQSPKPKQNQVSVSTVSTALGAPFEGNAVYPLSCTQPPSYTTLPQSEAVPSQAQPQKSSPLPPVPPESPLVAAGGDSHMRVELRSPYSPVGSDVSSRGRGGWRREDY